MSFGGPLREIKDPNTFSALAFVPPGAQGPMPPPLHLPGADHHGDEEQRAARRSANRERHPLQLSYQGARFRRGQRRAAAVARVGAALHRERDL